MSASNDVSNAADDAIFKEIYASLEQSRNKFDSAAVRELSAAFGDDPKRMLLDIERCAGRVVTEESVSRPCHGHIEP
jgi:hypothetical protein